MNAPTALGSIVRVKDGRIGTVVYNSLVGVGIKWGRHEPRLEDFKGTTGNTLQMLGGGEEPMPEEFAWEPDALLRDPVDGLVSSGWDCVGESVEVLRYGLHD